MKDAEIEPPLARHIFDQAAEDRRIEDRNTGIISCCSQISSKRPSAAVLCSAAVGADTHRWPTVDQPKDWFDTQYTKICDQRSFQDQNLRLELAMQSLHTLLLASHCGTSFRCWTRVSPELSDFCMLDYNGGVHYCANSPSDSHQHQLRLMCLLTGLFFCRLTKGI